MAKKKKKTPEEYRPIIADDPDEDFQDGAESSSLPQNILLIGEHVEGNRNIYISQKTYREIHRFTKGKTTNESGGVLVGQVTDELGRANVMIEGFIEAKHCEATPTTLKFTHETWEQIHADLDRKFPGKKIIGWIHTHPDFGIFLSEYDKFIQENFFSGEDQVAYVIDPIRHTEGFYFWVNGEIERCSGFYIYDEIGTQINAVGEHSEPVPAAKPSNAWKFVCGGMGAVIVICSACDMPHHKDCWVENGGCTTFGCLGGIKGVDDAPSSVTSTQMQFGAPGGIPMFQTDAAFCRACSAPLPADGAFCPKCGSRVGDSVQMNSGYPPQQENVPYPQQRIYQSGNGVNVQQEYYPNAQQVGYQQQYSAAPQNTDPVAVDTVPLFGSNAFYYKEKFHRMRLTGNKVSWNWCAFLFTPFWLIYRTMYGYGAAFLGGVLLLSLINDALCFIAALVGYFVFGIFGNYLYMQHTEKLANYLRWLNEPERSAAAARKGGTNSTAVVLAAICYLIAALIIFAVKAG